MKTKHKLNLLRLTLKVCLNFYHFAWIALINLMNILFLLLFAILTPSNTEDITLDCVGCTEIPIQADCYVLTGGPFQGSQIPLANFTSCSSVTIDFPMTISFVCDSSCNGYNSCGIQATYSGGSETMCSSTELAQYIIYFLNLIYSTQMADQSTYDWCSYSKCGLPSWAIILIVIFSILFVIASILVSYYCYRKVQRKKRNQQDNLIAI